MRRAEREEERRDKELNIELERTEREEILEEKKMKQEEQQAKEFKELLLATQVGSARVAEARNSESDTEIPTTHTDRCHSECIPEFRKFSVDDDIVSYISGLV